MDAEKDIPTSRAQKTPLLCSTRLSLSIIGFFMFFHLYAQRVGMSVAIVGMVNQTAVRMMSAGIKGVFPLQLRCAALRIAIDIETPIVFLYLKQRAAQRRAAVVETGLIVLSR